jgi:hypothetical protein
MATRLVRGRRTRSSRSSARKRPCGWFWLALGMWSVLRDLGRHRKGESLERSSEVTSLRAAVLPGAVAQPEEREQPDQQPRDVRPHQGLPDGGA